MNILVTGATGFIGRAFIYRLSQYSHNVYGLDSQVSKQDLESLPLKQLIIQDLTKSIRCDLSFDYVFHLGALNVTHVGKKDYDAYHRVNVEGTERLIRSVRTSKFVFMSTVKVYRDQEGSIDEESMIEPKDDYACSKLEAEDICQRYFDEEDLTIFRCVNVVGPGQAEKAVIPVFFKNAMTGKPLEIIYSEHTPVQMLDIDDLLDAFCLLLKKDKGVGIMNLCSDEIVTLGELAKEIIAMCGSKSIIQAKSEEQVAPMKYISKKAKDLLGWQAQISSQGILRKYHKSIVVNK